ncbi:MAG: hypothetical protein UY92_C0006G0112 [Candidatus Magasanikbacteria bacterium GW2011_GWA2_56_11]|uniref:Uncharacterized protein n=1 Tax=Candidatus Magasanikbacteria bacterium GW2011_GWA2_56_11 TaxID=1619044 RepID=A0A0G1YH31_9BACT|nr:MAG: hypothetical protein UY92_C0006G0112 [Candidatus Magasanikbacteria bacterium GW2011_GWA2_56_11]
MPMQNIQEVFSRLEKSQTRQKEIKRLYRDALDATPEYQEIGEKVKSLRERKKQVEQAIKESFAKELTELEDLSVDIESDRELMSDLALTQLVKGENVSVTDQYENEYEPVFSVKFKKMK